jgi:hypothetical protein
MDKHILPTFKTLAEMLVYGYCLHHQPPSTPASYRKANKISSFLRTVNYRNIQLSQQGKRTSSLPVISITNSMEQSPS